MQQSETLPVIERLATALRLGGVIFLSFKNRDEVWNAGGREFTGYKPYRKFTCGRARNIRPDRNETWLNILLRRNQ
jgi:hypothetical protein